MKKKLLLVAVMLLGCCFSYTANAGEMGSGSVNVITTVASSEWDKVLDEYEKYVDQYVKTYKKAMSGDMSAMAEYASLMQKAQKLSDKLEKAKGEMTTAQLQRYMKITQKMVDAIK